MQLYGEIYRRALLPIGDAVTRRPVGPILHELDRSQWRSPDEISGLQDIELQRLLRHAHEHVPLYRDRLDAAGVMPSDIRSAADLHAIPVLTPAEAREAGGRRKSLAPPFASITKRTTGSTGEPLEFEYDAGSEAWRQAVRMRGYGWAGYRQGDRTLYWWGMVPRPRHRRWWWRAVDHVWVAADRGLRREIYLDSTILSEERLANAVELIRRKRPSTIVTYAQAGVELARYVVATGAREWGTIPVLCGAEPLLPGDRPLLEQAFGPAVFETYGTREVMLIASECEAHSGLHVQAENLVVEVVVRNAHTGTTRPAAPGEVGELVVTDLHNLAMPFIRYVIGDLATNVPESSCRCGRGLPRIASVEGRTTDVLEDGAGRTVTGVTLLTLFVSLATAVRRYQVVQRRDRSLLVRIVPAPSFDESAREQIRRHVDRYLPGISTTIETVDAIEPGPAGKRRFIIREHE